MSRLHDERERNIRGLERVMTDWSEEDSAAFAACLRRFNAAVEALS
ncbi:hypothetical protein [Nonomuraea insulae]|uniref:MarR family transcriptional regulator n=1 Tax=Nonomuraea insulae TaxID=1616787 RepID=A0ABW1CJC4_9ACTN